MKLIENGKCDRVGCDREGPVTQIPVKSGGCVYLCFAHLHQAQAAHNIVGEKKNGTQ